MKTKKKFAVFSGAFSFAAAAPAWAEPPVLTLHNITMSVQALVHEVNPLLLAAALTSVAGVIVYRVHRAR